ncbi:alpha beta hydrolase family [Raphidocelis subcapitata]|uniref:Alpha beta hydrolase family n=1 Tax=Raphidocelis subcapitata TaxID=307507 RepID=A0A2V0PPQ7_9CHLO|nr:alpha beta hydrolase family [Raphidocelis subcapitata]|eukprot:GBF99175.1 alpha beta hydrolase family [Raphidocelis subcapitata]
MLHGVRAALAALVALLHARLVVPLVVWWEGWTDHAEESTKAFIRESFGLVGRALNGAGAWVMSALDASYAETQRRAWRQQQAWQHWWREDRTSTLNALVANVRRASGEVTASALGGAGGSGGAQRVRRPSSGGGGGGGPQADGGAGAEARSSWSLAGLLRRRRGGGSTSADALGAGSGAAPSPRQARAQKQQQQPATNGRPRRLSRSSNGGGSAGGAARRALQQAAGRSASDRGDRAAAFDAAGWWGVHEALARTGLLEDIRLSLEVGVTRAFEGLRWLVRRVTLSLKPAAAARAGTEEAQRPRRVPSSPSKGQPPPLLQLRGRRRPSGVAASVEERQGREADDDGGGGGGGGGGGPRHVRIGGLQSQGSGGVLSGQRSLSPRAQWPRQRAGSGDEADDEEGGEAGQQQEAAWRLRLGRPSPSGSPPPRGRTSSGGGSSEVSSPRQSPAARMGLRSKSFSGLSALAADSRRGRPLHRLRRVRSVGRFSHTPWAVPWEDGVAAEGEFESPTAAVIRMAGYPLMTYTVVTEDGYVLRLERIPRPGAPDVALFMHGVLDTSLTWVSSGVTGSQAFAAWDQGFDVWLGSSRSNPPRVATDPERQGMGYWEYTLNELGIYDAAAQIDKLHEVKMQELGGRDPRLDLRYAAGDLPATPLARRVGPFPPSSGGGAAAGLLPVSGEGLFRGDGAPGMPGRRPPPMGVARSISDQPHPAGAPPALAGAAARAARAQGGGGGDGLRRRILRDWLGGVRRGWSNSSDSGGAAAAAAAAAAAGRVMQGAAAIGTAIGSGLSGLASRTASADRLAAAPADDAPPPPPPPPPPLPPPLAQLPPRHRRPQSDAAAAPSPGAAGGGARLAEPQTPDAVERPALALEGQPQERSSTQDEQQHCIESTDKQQQQQQQWPQPLDLEGAEADGVQSEQRRRKQQELPPRQAAGAMPSPFASSGAQAGPPDAPAPAPAPAAQGFAWRRRSSSNGGSAGGGAGAPALYGPDAASGAGSGGAAQAAATTAVAAAGTVVAGVVIGTVAVAEATRIAASTLANAFRGGGDAAAGGSGSGSGDGTDGGAPAEASLACGEAARAAGGGGDAARLPAAAEAGKPSVADGGAERVVPIRPQSSVAALGLGEAGPSALAARAAAADGDEAPLPPLRRAHSSQAMFTLARASSAGELRASQAGLRGLAPQGGASGSLGGARARGSHSGDEGVDGEARRRTAAAAAAAHLERGPSGRLEAQQPAGQQPGGWRPPSPPEEEEQAWHEPRSQPGSPSRLPTGRSRSVGAPAGVPAAHCGQLGAASLATPRASGAGAREPYNLRVVAHSLGGASVLIYLVMRLRSGAPHRVSRLILLTPAGFHGVVPIVCYPVMALIPVAMAALRLVAGARAAAALYLPTAAARLLTFKFFLDFARLPALGDLLRAAMRLLLGGDRSQWDRAAQLPHYNARSMPAVSLHQGLHFIQLYRTGRFRLYDYGSPAANRARYGHPAPPDVASEYWRLDVPVDICAGAHDGVIPPANVRRHVAAMRAAGVDVSYREFDYGHLDFTFTTRDELRYFVLKRLARK